MIDRNTRSQARRERLAADQLCINGKRHGAATHGRLCAACRLVHRGLADSRLAAIGKPVPPPESPQRRAWLRADRREENQALSEITLMRKIA